MKKQLITLMLVLAVSIVSADAIELKQYVIGSGGGVISGGDFQAHVTIGQPVTGIVSNATTTHYIGFWAASLPTPQLVDNITDLKILPDGTYISIAGRIATSGSSDFADFFYIEDENRTSGIRVAVPASTVSGLMRGSIVNVIGTLGTASNGERQIQGPNVVIVGQTTEIRPLGMPGRSVGGADFGTPPSGQCGVVSGYGPNNVGLLITTWGKVTSVSGGNIFLDDGSGHVVCVDAGRLVSPPAINDHISVTGVSSLYSSGGVPNRSVLPRDDADVQQY